MKLLLLLTACIWLFSCTKDDPAPAKRLDRREEVYHDGSSQIMAFEYDATGRIVNIMLGYGGQSLQPFITVSYSGNEATATFQPFKDGAITVTRQLRLFLDADGRLLQKFFHAQKADASDPLFYEGSADTMNLSYDTGGFLQTISYHRYDSSRRSSSIWTSRDSFITQYTTIDGKLTNADQLGGTVYKLNDGGNITISTRTKEYHSTFSYAKQHPNNLDCSNAGILNMVIGFNASSQYYDVNVFEPIADARYRYLPDRTQKHALEVDGNGNIAVGFNSDVELDRTYNKDGMLENTEVLTPNQGLRRIKYFYTR